MIIPTKSNGSVPHERFVVVLRDPFAAGVQKAEADLRAHIALFGRQLVLFHRLSVILWDASAGSVHDTQVELGTGVALFGREPIPLHGFGVVLPDA